MWYVYLRIFLGHIRGHSSGPRETKGIASVIVPFTIPNALEAMEACLSSLKLQSATAWYRGAASAFPRWSVSYKGVKLLRAAPRLVYAAETVGLVPPNPWMVNSGQADRIAVESPRMLQVYREAGFPEGQLALTGSCADDMLYDAMQDKVARRETLYRQLNLPPGRPLLLSALVPNQLLSGVPDCEFAEYSELIEFFGCAASPHTSKNTM